MPAHADDTATLDETERVAIKKGIAMLAVPVSVTAVPFYLKLGFTTVLDNDHEEEHIIVIEHLILSRSRQS